MTDFTKRMALVTGLARGVGKAIALRYASFGAKVALNYADDEANAALTLAEVRNYGVGAVAIQADVSKVDSVERLSTQTIDWFGTLDIVVANAQLMGVQPEASR